ncbi:MAG: ATP synthase F1 subunit epsilon [Anaerolineae bacterium]|jgi:F-type H+-transporting ATPase subunit epsilon|nr:ATP synthase F1 subunit epsilon [Anaerolineae bacterium]
MPIHVDIVSQERLLFSEPEADMVLIPGTDGVLGVLPNHTPVLTTMKFGELVVRKGDAEEVFAIYGGVAEVRPDKVVILADSADFAADISEREIEDARERARQMLAQGLPEQEARVISDELRRTEIALSVLRKAESRGRTAIRIVRDRDSE